MKVNRIKIFVEEYPLLFLGVLFSIFHTLFYSFVDFRPNLYNDSDGYIVLANRILSLDFSNYQFERTPGYPFFLALGNLNLKIIILMQHLLTLGTSFLVYKIVRKYFGVCTNLILASLTFLSINCYFYECAILTETLSLFLYVSIVYLFTCKLDTNKGKIFIGIVCAFFMLTRNLYIYLPVIVLFMYLYSNKIRSIKGLFKNAFLFLFPTIIAFLFWFNLNKSFTGYFSLTPFFGINLAQVSVGFFETYEGEYQNIKKIYVKHIEESKKDASKLTKNSIWYAYDDLLAETGYDLPELSSVLSKMSKQLIIENKGLYAKQVFISYVDFWKSELYWPQDELKSFRGKSFIFWRQGSRAFQILLHIFFFIASIYYLFQYFIFKNNKFMFVAFIILSIQAGAILQALVIYGDNSRFSFPHYPMISFVTFFFVTDIYKRIFRTTKKI